MQDFVRIAKSLRTPEYSNYLNLSEQSKLFITYSRFGSFNNQNDV